MVFEYAEPNPGKEDPHHILITQIPWLHLSQLAKDYQHNNTGWEGKQKQKHSYKSPQLAQA